MGIGQSAGDLVSAWVTRCYSKLRFALSRRHGSSPAASAATNNDVSATSRRRSSHAVCSTRERSLLETAISQFTPFLCDRRDASRSDVHVQPRLVRAGTALGNHWPCVGLQHRMDDSAGHREAWTLSHSGSCSLVEAMAIRTAASANDWRAKGCEVNQKRKYHVEPSEKICGQAGIQDPVKAVRSRLPWRT